MRIVPSHFKHVGIHSSMVRVDKILVPAYACMRNSGRIAFNGGSHCMVSRSVINAQ